MKKIPVATINLRFLRLPLMLLGFILCISLSVSMCYKLPPIKLNSKALQSIIHASTAFIRQPREHVGVFALLGSVPSHSANTAITQKDKESVPSPTPISPSQNILSKTLQSSSEVKISNSTNREINAADYASEAPQFLKDNLSVLILHTHTTESYTPSEKYPYTPSDTDRTQDKNYNMVRVGNEIKNILTKNGIKVYHDTTINDYPSYNGSYNRSSANASSYIKNDPSIKIVLDVHRDAIEGNNGEKVKYITNIDGEDAACIMMVVGSDLSGLKHDNWESNMSFAVQLQQHIESMYPSLCRPINFRSQRFNQQLAPGALIIEVGTNGNTLEEALLGATYFANALSSYLNH